LAKTVQGLAVAQTKIITRAFLQEDDLGLWEEVGASDDHLISPADQTAGQTGFLHLRQLLS